MLISTITTKGQTTIPKEIREHLQLLPGDRVLYDQREGEVILRPVRDTLSDLRGSVQPRRTPEDFDDIREEVKKKVAGKATGA